MSSQGLPSTGNQIFHTFCTLCCPLISPILPQTFDSFICIYISTAITGGMNTITGSLCYVEQMDENSALELQERGFVQEDARGAQVHSCDAAVLRLSKVDISYTFRDYASLSLGSSQQTKLMRSMSVEHAEHCMRSFLTVCRSRSMARKFVVQWFAGLSGEDLDTEIERSFRQFDAGLSTCISRSLHMHL